mmetsp:Transcript_20674/g.2772  ORF Transcript_20674/g.2772 Transcript_20674/m.2772 type:complete len:89 (-) Transcript_20674:324-590(-)
MLGLILFTFISDNKGRKYALTMAWFLASLGSILFIVSKSLISIYIGNVFIGIGGQASLAIITIFLNENSTNHFSALSICIMYSLYGGA